MSTKCSRMGEGFVPGQGDRVGQLVSEQNERACQFVSEQDDGAGQLVPEQNERACQSVPDRSDCGGRFVSEQYDPGRIVVMVSRFLACVRGAAAAALVGIVPSIASASFVVSPMEHHLSVPAGDRASASLVIRNTGTRPLSLKLYLADSRFETDGRETEVTLGSLARSCAPWVDFGPELVELDPGAARTVFFDLKAPSDARGSYWTKLYIEEISTPDPIQQTESGRSYQVFMRQRMGVRIFEEIPGTAEPGMIVDRVQIESSLDETRIVTLSVANTGNVLLRCRGWVEVRNSAGEVVETLRPGADGKFTLFPGARREVEAQTTKELPPDTYTVLAIVDYGGDTLVAGEEILEISPRAGSDREKVAHR